MQGFMRQRGSSWELRVYVGRDPVTGRKRWVVKTVKTGKREAQRALAAMVAEADRGALRSTTATVGELLEEWFAHAAPGFSPKCVLKTRGVLDRNLLPFLGTIRLSKLGAADIDRHYRRLRDEGGRPGRPLAPGTIKRTHGVLHRALAQGVKWGWLAVNPAAAATAPRVLVADINPPAPHDLARVFALATEWDVEFADYIVLAAATGARRSELVALRWADVDLDRGSVAISRGIVASLDGLVEKDTKTHAARRVSLDPTCAAAMRAHRARAVERARLAECELSPLAFVFSFEVDGSKSWYPDSVSRTFTRLCRKAGCRRPACTIFAITSPPTCWLPASTSAPSPGDSATATPRRRSTSTLTSWPRRTATRPTPSARSSTTPSPAPATRRQLSRKTPALRLVRRDLERLVGRVDHDTEPAEEPELSENLEVERPRIAKGNWSLPRELPQLKRAGDRAGLGDDAPNGDAIGFGRCEVKSYEVCDPTGKRVVNRSGVQQAESRHGLLRSRDDDLDPRPCDVQPRPGKTLEGEPHIPWLRMSTVGSTGTRNTTAPSTPFWTSHARTSCGVSASNRTRSSLRATKRPRYGRRMSAPALRRASTSGRTFGSGRRMT